MSQLTQSTACCTPEAAAKRSVREVSPAADIFEDSTSILLEVDLPGVLDSELDVQVEEGVLSIRAANDKRRYRRAFQLPDGIEFSEISATLKNGVLSLKLPKAEAALPHKIEIKTSA